MEPPGLLEDLGDLRGLRALNKKPGWVSFPKGSLCAPGKLKVLVARQDVGNREGELFISNSETLFFFL